MRPFWNGGLKHDSPSTYALTLTREDVMVWIMNHDVSPQQALIQPTHN